MANSSSAAFSISGNSRRRWTEECQFTPAEIVMATAMTVKTRGHNHPKSYADNSPIAIASKTMKPSTSTYVTVNSILPRSP